MREEGNGPFFCLTSILPCWFFPDIVAVGFFGGVEREGVWCGELGELRIQRFKWREQ
jgi:hypothetical protein